MRHRADEREARPPTSSSALLVSAAAHAVAVADRHGGEHGVAPRPRSAGRSPRSRRAAQGLTSRRRSWPAPARARARGRRHPPGTGPGRRSPRRQRTRSKWLLGVAQQRGASWRRAGSGPGWRSRSGLAQASKRASCSPKKSSPRSSAVAKCVMAPDELAAGALAAAACATRVASSGSRVPRRPIPVSSLTCTRPPPRAATASTNASRQADDVGARPQRGVELLGAQRAEHQQRRLDAGGAQRRRLVGGRHRQPRGAAGQRRARRRPAPRGRSRRP